MPVNTDQATGWGGVGGAGGQVVGVPPADRAAWAIPQLLGHFPHLDFGAEPEKGAEEEERRGAGRDLEVCGSVCGKVFFLLFPLFLM